MKKTIVCIVLATVLASVPAAAYAKSYSGGSSSSGSRGGGGGGGTVGTIAKGFNIAPLGVSLGKATAEGSVTTQIKSEGSVKQNEDGSNSFIMPNSEVLRSDWAVVQTASGNVWKYFDKDGKMARNTWMWIKGKDGVARCYYFNADGVCLMNGETVDGYKVDKDGCWIVDGVVQTRTM